ncbi:site-specific integrase [Streptomyces sp. ISL-94]|uniref:site-specific integrase n=1 Tax=Streptomyces sp. ISL-94 TaxID=2819190 RepID=UPI001BE90B0F|nr:site-specific integrase [Streptomyces sp. ISL-94]MBT2478586.1 site-specific integrase [Streptomyces sp. ISL-94]
MSEFFRRPPFVGKAPGTQESYALDYRLFFTFLWRSGLTWDRATAEDLEGWEDWRLRAEANDAPIGGAKWGRELAALRMLYDWATARGYVAVSPVRLRSVRRRDGAMGEVPELAPADVRTSDVKWLTPRAWRLWRDVGLRGMLPDGMEDPAWRGRNDGRDAAFASLLYGSGLRRREAGTLLASELPPLSDQRFYAARLATAAAKRAGRHFYVSHASLREVSDYRLTTRALAVRRAQEAGVYERLGGVRVIEEVTRRGEVRWSASGGRTGRVGLNELDDRQRLRLFVRGPQGLEPAMLWLTESGLPRRYRGWSNLFARANRRCKALGLELFATPHMARHSFALRMVVSLHYAMDRRMGLSPDQRRHYEEIYGGVWSMVKDLLGHRSEETTRAIYLEPVRGLQLESLLMGREDSETTELLALIAERTGLVLDVPGAVA